MPAHDARHQLAARGALVKLRYQADQAAPPGPPSERFVALRVPQKKAARGASPAPRSTSQSVEQVGE